MMVFNLIELMEAHWDTTLNIPYSGNPYDWNKFPIYFSDHNPVAFRLKARVEDDD